MNKRIIVAFVLLAMLVSLSPTFIGGSHAAATSTSLQAKAQRAVVPGRVIIKYRTEQAAREAEAFIGPHLTVRSLGLPRLRVVEIPSDLDARAYAQLLRQMPDIEFAEPDYLLFPAGFVPNDPMYNVEWHLATINAPAAWSVTTGSSQITIAVCDTGVDATHPDLAAQIVPGWNVIDHNADTSPVHPHGTMVAGVAAAASNNAVGVAAPAMNCRVMPIRITSRSDGGAATSDIMAGAIWAADHGARIINVSYAGYGSSVISDAASYVRSKNSLFVMAAGNDGGYVPNVEDPNIFAVGATVDDDTLAGFSTTGPFIDLTAPGNGIWTTGLQASYNAVSGTSFSAPLVAGTAALILSDYPQLSAGEVEALLKVSADDRGPTGYDTGYGFGRLNAGRALELTAAKLARTVDVTAPTLRFLVPMPDGFVGQTRGELVQVEAVDDTHVARVQLYADNQLLAQKTAAPFEFTWDTLNLTDGSAHVLRAIAVDAAGNSRSLSLPVTVQAGYDITPPQIRILSPVDGANINPPNSDKIKSVRVNVNASDNAGILRVELYVDGELVTQTTQGPYTLFWPGDQVTPGQHILVCLAYDTSFNISRSNTVRVTR
ncbi:MAG: S8 family serine peptidase [Blastocatellia bacterium]